VASEFLQSDIDVVRKLKPFETFLAYGWNIVSDSFARETFASKCVILIGHLAITYRA